MTRSHLVFTSTRSANQINEGRLESRSSGTLREAAEGAPELEGAAEVRHEPEDQDGAACGYKHRS